MESVEYLGFLIEVVSPEPGTYEYSLFDMAGKETPEFPLFETDAVEFVSYEAAVDDAKSWIHDFLFYDENRAVEHIEKLYATKKALSSSPSAETTGGALQKLTAEVFDLPDCPEWAKWAAVDGDGVACYFADKPTVAQEGTCWERTQKSNPVSFWYTFDATDWQNSLIERPKKNTLPDWCRDGALGWENGDYFRLEVIDADHPVTMKYLDDGVEESVIAGYIAEHVKQARPRPYNAEEMKSLVGKVYESSVCTFLITGYDKRSNSVKVNEVWFGAKDLMNGKNSINPPLVEGKPCYVLEHLENGEWVE